MMTSQRMTSHVKHAKREAGLDRVQVYVYKVNDALV